MLCGGGVVVRSGCRLVGRYGVSRRRAIHCGAKVRKRAKAKKKKKPPIGLTQHTHTHNNDKNIHNNTRNARSQYSSQLYTLHSSRSLVAFNSLIHTQHGLVWTTEKIYTTNISKWYILLQHEL